MPILQLSINSPIHPFYSTVLLFFSQIILESCGRWTGYKFAPVSNDASGAPWVTNNFASFREEKNKNGAMEQSGAWEEMIYEKKLEVKNLVTLSF